MSTIKIKSSNPASQGPFVVIDRADFDPQKHELYDGESLGDSTGSDGAGGDGVPTLSELLAATNQLQAHRDALDDRELQLNQRADALDEREQQLLQREQANQLETERLTALAAANAGGAIDPASMTKVQLQAALTAKGISYPAAADKADLIALLAAAA